MMFCSNSKRTKRATLLFFPPRTWCPVPTTSFFFYFRRGRPMFSFVPRKVARKPKVHTNEASVSQSTRNVTLNHRPPERVSTSHDSQESRPSGKGKDKQVEYANDEDISALVRLSMSDHSLWLDPDLRRTIESSQEGYIPLTYLLSHSPYLSVMKPQLSEAALSKAIRNQLAGTFDVRVLVSSPSRAEWYGKASTSKDVVGGYEVRMKEWKDALQRARNMNRNDWELRTVYVENIPFQYRSIPAIDRFTTALLASESQDTMVQSIVLPKHHQDKPGDQPKCKGFALVTLSDTALVESLRTRWPWERHTDAQTHENEGDVFQEAQKIGFKSTTKSSWVKLNEEYLQYKQSLLDEMNLVADQDEYPDSEINLTSRKRSPSPTGSENIIGVQQSGPVTTLASQYPFGCLLFIRNVHPETNKTTLKALFSRALLEGDSTPEGIDYVDFNKGMDTCHLRVTTLNHARKIVDHFSANNLVQSGGLDQMAIEIEEHDVTRKRITVELVEGTREELYWGRVPEKVRRAAVEKAVNGIVPTAVGMEEGKPKRKRRRK